MGRWYGLARVKTTIDIDDDLLTEAKRRAAQAGTTLRTFIEDALRARLLPRARGEKRFHLELPTVRGTHPPRVDVADRRALYDLLDEPG